MYPGTTVVHVLASMYVLHTYRYTILYSLLVLDELLLSPPSLFGPCMGHLPWPKCAATVATNFRQIAQNLLWHAQQRTRLQPSLGALFCLHRGHLTMIPPW